MKRKVCFWGLPDIRKLWCDLISKRNSKHLATALGSFLLLVALFSGSETDSELMRNPKTGEEVVCRSDPYLILEGLDQQLFMGKCLSACARFGFAAVDKNSATTKNLADALDKDGRSSIPSRCL